MDNPIPIEYRIAKEKDNTRILLVLTNRQSFECVLLRQDCEMIEVRTPLGPRKYKKDFDISDYKVIDGASL